MQAMGAAAPPSRPLRVAGYRYAVALLAPAGAVAPGTPPSTFAVADPSRPLLEDNALAITVGQPGGRTGDRIPDLDRVRRPGQPGRGGRQLPGRAARARHPHAQAADPVAGGQTSPDRFAPRRSSGHDSAVPRGPGASRGQAGGVARASPDAAAACLRAGRPRPFDAVGLPHATGLKRLYLASRANLPGLGLEGELVSGWGVAHLISGGQTRRHPGQRGRRILG